MPWPSFTPLLLFYNFVQLMLLSAVAVADFPLFMFMLIYKVLYYPGRIYAALQVLGQNLPVVFGQTIT